MAQQRVEPTAKDIIKKINEAKPNTYSDALGILEVKLEEGKKRASLQTIHDQFIKLFLLVSAYYKANPQSTEAMSALGILLQAKFSAETSLPHGPYSNKGIEDYIKWYEDPQKYLKLKTDEEILNKNLLSLDQVTINEDKEYAQSWLKRINQEGINTFNIEDKKKFLWFRDSLRNRYKRYKAQQVLEEQKRVRAPGWFHALLGLGGPLGGGGAGAVIGAVVGASLGGVGALPGAIIGFCMGAFVGGLLSLGGFFAYDNFKNPKENSKQPNSSINEPNLNKNTTENWKDLGPHTLSTRTCSNKYTPPTASIQPLFANQSDNMKKKGQDDSKTQNAEAPNRNPRL